MIIRILNGFRVKGKSRILFAGVLRCYSRIAVCLSTRLLQSTANGPLEPAEELSLLRLFAVARHKGRFKILTWILFFGMFSCIDEYNPGITSYENLLVVDGGISNEPGPYSVRLSLSSRVEDPQFIPVQYAFVRILDNMGQEFLLNETDPGHYASDSSALGEIGKAYKIEIITSSGTVYSSPFEELKTPVGIDTVVHEIETRQTTEYDYDLYGYAFYVNTRLAEGQENYLKWDLEATYQYQSEYTIRWYFDGELHWFHGPDSLYNCWSSHKEYTIYIRGTGGLTEPIIRNFPLNFVSTEDRQLSVRYSLLVKQSTISQKAFDYWDEVKKQNGGQSSLYSTQPYFIRGNVYNQSNPENPVLGYFMVNGIEKMRIFVDRPPLSVPMNYPMCKLTEADFEAYGQMGMMDPVFYPIYAIETNGGRRATPNQLCVDCRRKGGTITKPVFWID